MENNSDNDIVDLVNKSKKNYSLKITNSSKKQIENNDFNKILLRQNKINKYNEKILKNNIYEWCSHPCIKKILIDLYNDFLTMIKNENYELVICKKELFNKFISLVYHSNIV